MLCLADGLSAAVALGTATAIEVQLQGGGALFTIGIHDCRHTDEASGAWHAAARRHSTALSASTMLRYHCNCCQLF